MASVYDGVAAAPPAQMVRDTAELRHGDDRHTVKLVSRSVEGRRTRQRAVRGELTPEEIAEIPEIFHPLLRHLKSPLSAETGATVLPSASADRKQPGTMRARSKLANCASSRETASAVARSRLPREHRLVLGGRNKCVVPRPRAEGERPLVGAIPLPSAAIDHNQRGAARARSKLACCASSR